MNLQEFQMTELTAGESIGINGGTDGGATFAYYAGQVLGWGINVLRGLYVGASESAQEMPGLK